MDVQKKSSKEYFCRSFLADNPAFPSSRAPQHRDSYPSHIDALEIRLPPHVNRRWDIDPLHRKTLLEVPQVIVPRSM